MKNKRSSKVNNLYERFGISSLRAKLLIPVAILMVITLAVSILIFSYSTSLTQNQLMKQQLDVDANELEQGFKQRLAELSSAATVLANDPLTLQNMASEGENTLAILSGRALSVRDRYDLDMVSIVNDVGIVRVSLASDGRFQPATLSDETGTLEPLFYYSNGRMLLIERKEIPDNLGAVFVGIEMNAELERQLQRHRLASDVTLSINGTLAGDNQDISCDMKTGLIGESYIQKYEYELADTSVCMLLSRPAVYVQQVLRTGRNIMITNAILTILLLSGLLVAMTSAISKPIRRLSNAAQAVAYGDLTRHVTADDVSSIMGIGQNDELSLQAQAFNRMVADLNTLYSHLEEQVSDRTRELSATTEVARAVAESRLNLQSLSRDVSKAIRRRFDFDAVAILRYDHDQEQVCLLSGAQVSSFQDVTDGICMPVEDKALFEFVLLGKQVRTCQVIALEPLQYRLPYLPISGSYAAVPIMTADKVYGLVYAQHHLTNYMSSDISALLQTFADQIAIGFENVELYTVAQEARDAAQAADQAKSQFLARMSHELRTPMNAILGFTQVLQRSETSSPRDREYLDIIYRSSEHLLLLINDILDMAKIEAGHATLNLANFDLYDQLAELELMFRMRAEEAGLVLYVERDPDVPRFIRSDQSKLRQVLINLLGNAIKFTQAGAINMRVGPVAKLETITSPLGSLNHQRIHFEVKDTGSGIAERDLDRIFEAFVQTASGSQLQQGTGLGLPISREFVRLMGGELKVESKIGEGSTFYFDLDVQIVASGDDDAFEQRRVVGIRPGNQPLKVLVISRDLNDPNLVAEMMRNIGINPQEVQSNEEAITVVQTWQPDLIFVDAQTPGLSADLVTKQIREACNQENRSCPVVIAIISSLSENANEVVRWCDEVIRKPVHEYKLYNAIQKHLNVEYITDEIQDAGTPQSDTSDILFSARQLTPLTRSMLESAITRLDMQDITEMVQEIRNEYPALGIYLQNLAASFDYDTILHLLRHTGAAD